MRTLVHDIDISEDASPIWFCYLTDTHIGAKACAEDLLRQDIEAIKNHPRCYWAHGGDFIDCIARKGDKRYNEETIAAWLHGKNDVIGAQMDYFIEMVEPIASKCLAVVEGNHEFAAVKYHDRDVYGRVIRWLAGKTEHVRPESIAVGYQGFLVLRFRQKGRVVWSVSMYLSHGYGGNRLAGGASLALERALGDYSNIDIVLMGHRHLRQYVEKLLAMPDIRRASRDGTLHVSDSRVKSYRAGNVATKLRQGMFVPSYLNSYVRVSNNSRPIDTYAEQFGFPPKHLGGIPIKLDPREKIITFLISDTQGLSHLLSAT